jgi:hypothetical protein
MAGCWLLAAGCWRLIAAVRVVCVVPQDEPLRFGRQMNRPRAIEVSHIYVSQSLDD